jgi:hypothetical protein
MEIAVWRSLSGTACAGMGGRDEFLTKILSGNYFQDELKREDHVGMYCILYPHQ